MAPSDHGRASNCRRPGYDQKVTDKHINEMTCGFNQYEKEKKISLWNCLAPRRTEKYHVKEAEKPKYIE